MRIGLFGGTFNPPHAGHIALAKSAVKELSLSKLLLMPAFIPPHKPLPPGSADAEERFEMTALAAESIPGGEASRLELQREERSYTVDTLRELREIYPEDEIFLIVGGDMFLSLDHWFRAQEIFRLARIAAAAREEEELPLLEKQKGELERRFGARVTLLSHRVLRVSSSEIREAVARGGECPLLPEKIREYIRERKLYL